MSTQQRGQQAHISICDKIISTQIITAEGMLVTADAENSPDLLWALKGAGQFFGVVTELGIRTQPMGLLERDGEVWARKYVFLIERTQEVCAMMEKICSERSLQRIDN